MEQKSINEEIVTMWYEVVHDNRLSKQDRKQILRELEAEYVIEEPEQELDQQ